MSAASDSAAALVDSARELGAGLYRLLAGAFVAPPAPELLAPLVDPGTADAAEALLGVAVAERLRELGRLPVDPVALRQEFFDLLAVPTSRYVTPFESVYCDERDVAGRPVRGLLGGPSTDAVRRCYERAGFRVEARELPDHIACELAFLGELHGRAAGGQASAVEAAAVFAAAHPARWLPALVECIAENARSAVFPALARLAAALVAADAARCATGMSAAASSLAVGASQVPSRPALERHPPSGGDCRS
ncbi:MAG: molecular chaperone TorD family protein [Deltaproteobacteria bacterium]|nr:molecular chaperone TorD family protein [Deltaproteobacteria bacterium]